ncbi:hypothetical protein [Sodalis-like endosymbiont of Proechinophthirus fluctus]|uniref:hypothetical protein n=1 Tax=Sodalis-like endosymbiont of Proechinophthirus fluctus TaxID=1462730 RepID=UPI001FCB7AEB|nr:hypothetical protein [Sodalis-like endosymbiont of Proechinophthirus fluctus]
MMPLGKNYRRAANCRQKSFTYIPLRWHTEYLTCSPCQPARAVAESRQKKWNSVMEWTQRTTLLALNVAAIFSACQQYWVS